MSLNIWCYARLKYCSSIRLARDTRVSWHRTASARRRQGSRVVIIVNTCPNTRASSSVGLEGKITWSQLDWCSYTVYWVWEKRRNGCFSNKFCYRERIITGLERKYNIKFVSKYSLLSSYLHGKLMISYRSSTSSSFKYCL